MQCGGKRNCDSALCSPFGQLIGKYYLQRRYGYSSCLGCRWCYTVYRNGRFCQPNCGFKIVHRYRCKWLSGHYYHQSRKSGGYRNGHHHNRFNLWIEQWLGKSSSQQRRFTVHLFMVARRTNHTNRYKSCGW